MSVIHSSSYENFIQEDRIREMIQAGAHTPGNIPLILKKARGLEGLLPEEAAVLLGVQDPEVWLEIFRIAQEVKERIYGNRIVVFAPLYLSNYCLNSCSYCGYHRGSGIERRKLNQAEIVEEVKILESMGHKRLAIETGEDPVNCPIEYVLESLATIYQVRHQSGNIRRVNVNVAAASVDNYRKLKAAGIGTYILFQETYHQASYEKYHPHGPKSDYFRQLTAFDRAISAGIDDIGAGVLFGLYDYRFDLIALLCHAAYLEQKYGVGPHTVSVPRLRPARGVRIEDYPYLISDNDLARIVALLRIALPYTGIILSTREKPEVRRRILKLGVSQISAGSCTGVGGYSNRSQNQEADTSQFQVEDHRAPDDVYAALCRDGYLPSFCTACYRQGRTGDRFMALAKSGEIGKICTPNAILTFQEYLIDYASPGTKVAGAGQLQLSLSRIDSPALRRDVERKLERIQQGERDLYY
ncbi:MAG: [FeFe] hydrogenase H-cluster radical SAM maturase HydG [Firmicutes bacterium]|nr:[FeFe] hydrogenase H-cluster radical SAM maturase HydG [Bacillota bacterium]